MSLYFLVLFKLFIITPVAGKHWVLRILIFGHSIYAFLERPISRSWKTEQAILLCWCSYLGNMDSIETRFALVLFYVLKLSIRPMLMKYESFTKVCLPRCDVLEIWLFDWKYYSTFFVIDSFRIFFLNLY